MSLCARARRLLGRLRFAGKWQRRRTSESAQECAIGIDLGTTNCGIAVHILFLPRVVQNVSRLRFLPYSCHYYVYVVLNLAERARVRERACAVSTCVLCAAVCERRAVHGAAER
eukprot:5228153-Pleurochrysis_carterae.AAC.1